MELIDYAFGAWNAGDGEWQVVVPELAAGDHLILFGITWAVDELELAAPAGFTEEVALSVAYELLLVGQPGFQQAWTWTAEAAGNEEGHTIAIADALTFAGVLLVVRGGVLPAVVVGVSDPATLDNTEAVTDHPAVGAEGSQPSDLRLYGWWIAYAADPTGVLTLPTDDGVTEIGQYDDLVTNLRFGAVLFARPPGAALELEATTSDARDAAIMSVALRSQPVPRPVGLVPDAEPGRVGLEG